MSTVRCRVSRLKAYLLRLDLDSLVGLLLFMTGFYAYTYTLAPTVLEGDAALFQYTPYVLGVTYPTGYPLYILLGKLWLTLFPLGEIAWRMNLFSALCSAAALPLIYGAARRLYLPEAAPKDDRGQAEARWAALAAVLIFATIPTFWRWATEAKIYALNILLFSGVLYTLSRTLAGKHGPGYSSTSSAARTALSFPARLGLSLSEGLRPWPLALPVLLTGLQITVHSTTVLLLPGLLLFAWLNLRPYLFTAKRFWGHCLLLAAPGLLYFYIPLRAEWLIARYGRLNAIGQGLLADFYHSGPDGLLIYFSAAEFTGGVVTNWGQVPTQFFSVYVPLLREDLTLLGVALGLVGGAALAISQPRRFWPLLLIYAAPVPFVLAYGQGEQSAFLLPSFLIFALFAGYIFTIIPRVLSSRSRAASPSGRYSTYGAGAGDCASTIRQLAASLIPFLLLLALIPALFLPQVEHNLTWLSRKWTRAIYDEWADALNHPLPPGAGLLAHWGDLTTFWYMQQVEGRRPDLRGIYPPDEAAVLDWFARGHNDLYISGPLQGWAAGIEERYQLIPWGRLVRIAPREFEPLQLLPQPAYALEDLMADPLEATFGDRLRLLGVDFEAQAVGGQPYPVTLTWQTLAELPERATVSLRLTRGDGIVAQLDQRLRSGWFPRETLPAGQPLLSYALIPIPLGTLPGEYELQMVAYDSARRPWPLPGGGVTLELGRVTVAPAPPGARPDPNEFKRPPAHNFDDEIELAGYSYTVSRVGQGKGFGLVLLWRTRQQPAGNYTLIAEALDAGGNLLRSTERQPLEGLAPTGSWQPGHYIRDQLDLVTPAGAPPGEAALQVRLSWQRLDGTRLPLQRWGFALDDGLRLGWLAVTEKEGRVFSPPPIRYPLAANLDNKAALLGYNTPLPAGPDAPQRFILNKAACIQTEAGDCRLQLTFFWQGLGQMALPYQIFVHLVDSQGQIAAQLDVPPGPRGKEPTTGWLPGELVTHPVELLLPPDLPPGVYTLHLGMYLPPDGPRLLVLDEAGDPTTDFVAVGSVEIRQE